MTKPCDDELLWMKAKAQLNRSFAAKVDDDFEAAALWAACALELLAKAALARVHPVLIADPTGDGSSLLFAAGLITDQSSFKSVPAKTLFSRCSKAFRRFNEAEANRIARQRNEELHAGGTPFLEVEDTEAWWARYWALTVILIDAQERTINDLVGGSRASAVEAYLVSSKKNTQDRLATMIEQARRRVDRAEESEDVRLRIAASLSRSLLDLPYEQPATCPACNHPGRLLGEDVFDSSVEVNEDEEPYELAYVNSDAFVCERCGLQLSDPDLIAAAGLPDAIEVEREYDPAPWDDYGND